MFNFSCIFFVLIEFFCEIMILIFRLLIDIMSMMFYCQKRLINWCQRWFESIMNSYSCKQENINKSTLFQHIHVEAKSLLKWFINNLLIHDSCNIIIILNLINLLLFSFIEFKKFLINDVLTDNEIHLYMMLTMNLLILFCFEYVMMSNHQSDLEHKSLIF